MPQIELEIGPEPASPASAAANDLSPDLQWGPAIEVLMARWCDEAKAHEWMHTESCSLFGARSKQIMITLNVLMAISGFSNVITGGTSWPGGFQPSWLFGGLSIAVSILTMLQDKLNYASSATEHGIWAQRWTIVRRRIEEELAVPVKMRKSCESFLKSLRHEINQISTAGSQKIPESVRKACRRRFEKVREFELPEICGVAEHTRVYVELPGGQ
jgi:hypothetical protein